MTRASSVLAIAFGMMAQAVAVFAGPLELLGTQQVNQPASSRNALSCPAPPTLAQLLANPLLIQTKEDAQQVLDQMIKDAGSRPGTMADWNATIRAMEILSPQSGTRDIARFLRRKFYDDGLLQLVGIKPAEGEPNLSPELKRYEYKLDALKKWQVVQGKQGELDFAHALVAIDAYSWQRNPIGRTKGWIFTYFGDAATGALAAFGADGAGNNNLPDQRGNDLGRTLVRTSAAADEASLSALVSATQAPPQMSRWL